MTIVQRPMRFRTRLFAILSLFALIPAIILTILGGAAAVSILPLVTGQAGWDSVAATGRRAMAAADSAKLTPGQRAAFDAHERELRASLEQAQRLNYLLDRGGRVLVISSILALAAIGFGASRVAGHLSRQMSRPIDELVDWTDLIRRGDPLPNPPPTQTPRRRGAPEFETLRQRMRVAAVALDIGRQRAMEAERLRAFRESARQAAHELKNPLTPIRFAIARLKRDVSPDLMETVEVLETESARLERTARSFAQFGKLPEGPAAPIDLTDLLRYVTVATIPESMQLELRIDPEIPMIMGHHDALAGALTNVLLNAVDASHGLGSITVDAERTTIADVDAVRIRITDTGPGIDPERLKRIWEPYVTHKAGGTGLGLTIARQAVWAHNGTVEATSTIGVGTQIEFTLPVSAGANPVSI